MDKGKPPATVGDLIARWPTMRVLAADCGVSISGVASWRARGTIKPVHWPLVIQSAARHRIPGVSERTLLAAIAGISKGTTHGATG